ncbi:MAG: hypothetical protein QNJ15_15795 [Erythrobacter sp.]|nr:hypothetical protein [Erythrobacter sp.]
MAAFALALTSAPGLAQQQAGDEVQPSEDEVDRLVPDEGRLLLEREAAGAVGVEQDEIAVERCEDEADIARVAGEIIVCRDLGEASDGAWDKSDWERRYAAATQGPKPVFQDAGGLQFPAEGSLATITVTLSGVCVIPPCPRESALLIDVEALPEAPPGSDADRIARGLPPLGREPEQEERRRRREDLGLPAPSFSDEDE